MAELEQNESLPSPGLCKVVRIGELHCDYDSTGLRPLYKLIHLIFRTTL